jgi:tetratricopeptide (TPR) repeat protein
MTKLSLMPSPRAPSLPAGALFALLALLWACGPKTGVKGGNVPPPPKIVKSENAAPGKGEPKREVSKDARADFEAAAQLFAQTDKAHGWNDSTCRQAADRFATVVRAHTDLVEAQFMVGLSYHRCNMAEDAERAYRQAIQIKPNHGASLSGLGALYYRAGKVDEARQYWETAIKANGKLTGARIDLASLQLEEMRKIGNLKDPRWKKLEEDARFNLSSTLGVDADSVAAYTVYGLVYMEGWQANKNRLDLAKLLLDEAKKRNERYAPLQNAYGLLYMHRASLNQALASFNAAVEIDPRFVEGRINVGQVTLGFRKYDVAKEMFEKAIELAPKNYDAYIGLGIALRGLKDLDGAEAQYKKARDIDPRRGEAFYNLAVLYKDFRASKGDFVVLQAGQGLLPAVPDRAGGSSRQERGQGADRGDRQDGDRVPEGAGCPGRSAAPAGRCPSRGDSRSAGPGPAQELTS